MLGPEANLVLYRLGFGFVIVLGWAAVTDELNKTLDPVAADMRWAGQRSARRLDPRPEGQT